MVYILPIFTKILVSICVTLVSVTPILFIYRQMIIWVLLWRTTGSSAVNCQRVNTLGSSGVNLQHLNLEVVMEWTFIMRLFLNIFSILEYCTICMDFCRLGEQLFFWQNSDFCPFWPKITKKGFLVISRYFNRYILMNLMSNKHIIRPVMVFKSEKIFLATMWLSLIHIWRCRRRLRCRSRWSPYH